MPPLPEQTALVRPLLERLVDETADGLDQPRAERWTNWRDLTQSIRRDLENLLNTRPSRPEANLAEEFPEIAESVLAYGLADFSTLNLGTHEQQEDFRWRVEQCIRRFEPRIQNVYVRLDEVPDERHRTLKLSIEGVVGVEPYLESVRFASQVDAEQRQCRVEEV